MNKFRKTFCLSFLALLYTLFSVLTISGQTIPSDEDSEIDENIYVYDNSVDIESEAAILIDAKTGVIVYGKNIDEKLFPASITKVMTALLTIEHVDGNYNDKVLFTKDAVYGIEPGSSHIAMDFDETLTVDQALYGLMLASANEVANALAEYVGGTYENFYDMMNERAKELGAYNTNFANAHGLPNDNHYTTAYDFSLIMQEAVKHDKFIELIKTKQASIPPTEKQELERPLNNTNKLIFEGSNFYCDTVVGGKTGYTDLARHTLTTYSVKNDMEFISVILKGEKNVPYTDCIKLLDYGFSSCSNVTVFSRDDYSTEKSFTPDEGSLVKLKITGEKDLELKLPKTIDVDKIYYMPSVDEVISPDVSVGDGIGTLDILYNDKVIETIELVVDNVDIQKITPEQYMSINGITGVAVFNEDFDNDSNSDNNGRGIIGFIKKPLFYVPLVLIVLISLLAFALFKRQKRQQYRLKHRRPRYKTRIRDLK